MPKYLVKIILLTSFFSHFFTASAQKVSEPKNVPAEWSKYYPPFRIAGNLYYVGTEDLACYLITSADGNILVNTGLAGSMSLLKQNVEALGFKLADTKILLNMQAHFDHMGAMASIKRLTGAKIAADEKDARVMADGGSSDYALGGNGSTFEPVVADRLLRDRDTVKLGDVCLVMLHHPGHTKGSCSFLFEVKDQNRSYRVLLANMPTIVTEKKFSEVTTYPDIVKDYTYTLNAMKNLSFDIWLSAHASQFDLHKKHTPGDSYNPAAFMDKKGYDKALSDLQSQFSAKVKNN